MTLPSTRAPAAPIKPIRPGQTHQRPLRYWDVYVDDFVGLAQGNATRRKQVKRALFHNLDRVLHPLEPRDNPHRQEPASVKKLLKGDATWCTLKTILGWVVDTEAETVQLPPH